MLSGRVNQAARLPRSSVGQSEAGRCSYAPIPRRAAPCAAASAGTPAPDQVHAPYGLGRAPYGSVLAGLCTSNQLALEHEVFSSPNTSSSGSCATPAAPNRAPVPFPGTSLPVPLSAHADSMGSTTGLDKQLSVQLKAARTWREVKEVLAAADSTGAWTPTLLSTTFCCLPRLLRQHPRLSDKEQGELAAAVQGLVSEQVVPLARTGALDAQALVSVAVGLAKLGHTHPTPYHAIAHASVPHMQAGALPGQCLSSLVWALATAGVRPEGAWLSQFWTELEAQLETLSLTHIANIWWAICRLELMPPWATGAMPGMLPAVVHRCCVEDTAAGQDVATIMVCLAIWSRSYSWRAPEEVLEQVLGCIQPHLRSYLPQDLVSLVHSLVVMNHSPARPWMTSYYQVLRDRLVFDPTLGLTDFQRLLWALSRVEYTPSTAWLRQFVEVSRVKLRHLRYQALSELIWALSCWGYTPTREWLAEYYRVTLPQLAQYRPAHLANSLQALKKLGAQVPSPWLDAALLSFCNQLGDIKASQLVDVIDGVVEVCEDAAWMRKPDTGRRLRMLADHAAARFDLCVPVQHAKLLLALAAARCYPGASWLSQHQDALGRSLGTAEDPSSLNGAMVAGIRGAYEAWDVPLSASLQQELERKSP